MSLINKGQSDVKRHISLLGRKHFHVESSFTEHDANGASVGSRANPESDAAGLARRFAEDIFPAIVPAHVEGPSAVLPKPGA
jgi:hypothetical protein